MICAPFAMAQNSVGELLDAGAKTLSVDRFRQDVVGRLLIGPMATGGTLEIVYIGDGRIDGTGQHPTYRGIPPARVSGTWTVDDGGRICTGMRVAGSPLPNRCQVWFRYDEDYYLADSDTDRSAKVVKRAIKQ